MSIGNKIKGLFGSAEATVVTDPEEQLIIVDGVSMASSRKDGGAMSPREQIDILQSLSRINKRENLAIRVVFAGEPLRKVDHGEHFDEVQVFFEEAESKYAATVMEKVKEGQRARTVVLITSDEALEAKAQAQGVTTIRSASFKKGFDETPSSRGGNRNNRRGGGGAGGGGKGENSRGANSGNRRRSSGNRNRPPKQPRSEAVGGSDVSDLIDLVD